jgi:hypothetical protein
VDNIPLVAVVVGIVRVAGVVAVGNSHYQVVLADYIVLT